MSQCPKCGKPSRGLCVDCYLGEHPLELGEPKLYSCKCGKLRFHGKWDASLDDVSKSIAKNIKTPYELRLGEIKVEPEVKENQLQLDIQVEGLHSGEKFKKNLTQKVKIQNATCPTCGRKSSGRERLPASPPARSPPGASQEQSQDRRQGDPQHP